MNEGAGKRGAARQQRQQTMAIQRQMLGRVKPAKSAEPLATGGTLAARASLGRARAKAGPGASPAQRGAVTRAGTYLKASKERNRAAVKGAMPKGTMAKPKGQKPGAVNPAQGTRLPAAQRPGSLTNTLRGTLRNLARTDAARIREIESITGQKIRRTPAGAGAAKEAGARVRAVAKGGKVGPTLRAGLRELAQSDARSAREMASIVRDATPKLAGGKGGKVIRGGRPVLPGGKAKTVAAKPTAPKRISAARTAGTVAKPKGLKPGAVTARVKAATKAATVTGKGAMLGGKMARTSLPKPGTVAPMKGQDKAFQSLANLRKAEVFSSPKALIKSVFLPREQMTQSRAKKVGLVDRNGLRRSSAESPRMRVAEMTSGSRQGYVISPRGGVKANQARQRMAGTVAKRRTKKR